jgi:hypothetical protein
MFWEFEKEKKKRAFKIRKRRYQLLPSPLLPPSFFFFFLPSTEKVEENISNSGGSHGRLGMRNSGFWKERKRKRKKTKPVFFFGYISFSCSFPTSLPDDLPLFLYYYYYYYYIYIFEASQPAQQPARDMYKLTPNITSWFAYHFSFRYCPIREKERERER